MEPLRLTKIWCGDDHDPYATAAIVGTLAIALKLLRRASSVQDAQKKAELLWKARDTSNMLPSRML